MGCGSDLQDLWFWESYALCVRVSINLWRHASNLQDPWFWESYVLHCVSQDVVGIYSLGSFIVHPSTGGVAGL